MAVPNAASSPLDRLAAADAQPRADGGHSPAALLPKSLTPEALDAFIAYQETLLEVDRGLGADPTTGSLDGGASAATKAAERRRLEALATLEDEARRRSHLSDAELDAWESLVTDVLAARGRADPELERDLAKKLDRLAERAPGLDLRQGAAPEMAAVRARYGDAAVELVLSREAVLRRQLEGP